MEWKFFSYIGLFFAVIYRVPQIVKIYRSKSAADLSSYSYLTHNGAYASFILYLVGTGKLWDEWVLCFYYFMGISQNMLIFAMKTYYARERVRAEEPAPTVREAVLYEMPSLGGDGRAGGGEGGASDIPAGHGLHNRRSTYAQRRAWFKRQVVGTEREHEQMQAAGYCRVDVRSAATATATA